ncbi:MAG: hypothetical protein PVH11_14175 [Anaerolineae bacterium]|jgi:hypothetical protein
MSQAIELLPLGSRIDDGGRLWLGGCQASALAATYGTPAVIQQRETYQDLLARDAPLPAA